MIPSKADPAIPLHAEQSCQQRDQLIPLQRGRCIIFATHQPTVAGQSSLAFRAIGAQGRWWQSKLWACPIQAANLLNTARPWPAMKLCQKYLHRSIFKILRAGAGGKREEMLYMLQACWNITHWPASSAEVLKIQLQDSSDRTGPYTISFAEAVWRVIVPCPLEHRLLGFLAAKKVEKDYQKEHRY